MSKTHRTSQRHLKATLVWSCTASRSKSKNDKVEQKEPCCAETAEARPRETKDTRLRVYLLCVCVCVLYMVVHVLCGIN